MSRDAFCGFSTIDLAAILEDERGGGSEGGSGGEGGGGGKGCGVGDECGGERGGGGDGGVSVTRRTRPCSASSPLTARFAASEFLEAFDNSSSEFESTAFYTFSVVDEEEWTASETTAEDEQLAACNTLAAILRQSPPRYFLEEQV